MGKRTLKRYAKAYVLCRGKMGMNDKMKLQIEYIPITEIKPYRNNAKIHTAEQIEQIAKSIKEFGFNDPIAISNGVIVEGHGRLLAARKLGIDTIPVIKLDGLTEPQRRAYTLIHNQLTLNSDFDLDILNNEIEDLQSLDDFNLDFEDFGFNDVFSIDDIEEVQGYDKNNDNRQYFEKTFTFPIEKKQQITNYLKKHYDEVVSRIIKDAEENY